MPIYMDEVDSSVQKVRAVLSERGMLEGFTSSIKDEKTAQVSEEIINFISLQLEQYLTDNASETIDQVSGRIQAKLDDLNETGVSVSDEAIEKIKQFLPDNKTDKSSNDISENIIQILNGIGFKIAKFKKFISKTDKKINNKKKKRKNKNGLPDKELFIKFIDEVLPDVVFFDNQLEKLQEYLIK